MTKEILTWKTLTKDFFEERYFGLILDFLAWKICDENERYFNLKNFWRKMEECLTKDILTWENIFDKRLLTWKSLTIDLKKYFTEGRYENV